MSNIPIETDQPVPAEPFSEQQNKLAPRSKNAKKIKARKKVATKSAPKSRKNSVAKPAAPGSNKKAQVMALMKRAKGVTLAEIVAATGWQKHTVRGFMSIIGTKGGEKVESSKNAAGERTYRILD